MPAALINQVAQALADDTEAAMATACTRLEDRAQLTDSSVVKVVADKICCVDAIAIAIQGCGIDTPADLEKAKQKAKQKSR